MVSREDLGYNWAQGMTHLSNPQTHMIPAVYSCAYSKKNATH